MWFQAAVAVAAGYYQTYSTTFGLAHAPHIHLCTDFSGRKPSDIPGSNHAGGLTQYPEINWVRLF
jgi:hypothetical protein